MKQLTVDLGTRSYPIYIGEHILKDTALWFEKNDISKLSPVLIVTDKHVADLHLDSVRKPLQSAGYEVFVFVVPAGEQSKSLGVFEDIVTAALEAGLDRKSTLIALGGGVVGDLAGFVAASYMRGIRFVQVPTTILAHDSSVGGKVAVNHPLAKNIIGAFHQPQMVIYDTETLHTLPPRDARSGFAEMIKHGLIWDASFVRWCDGNADKLLELDAQALQYGLYQGCKIKANVVSQDEREDGLRAILNLGHTIGHALEAVHGYSKLLHGEAISIGMVGAARLALRFGYSETIVHTTKSLLKKFDLPVRLPGDLDHMKILQAMSHDKKFRDKQMVFIIPTDIGKVEIRSDVPTEWVEDVLIELRGEN